VSSTEASIPAAVRTSFRLYLVTVAVSVVNVATQVHFNISPELVLLNPVIELALFLGIGLPMRAGKPWARVGMASVAALIVVLNLVFIIRLTSAFGQYSTLQVVLLLVLAGGKVALLGAATWMMYRPQTQDYFR
jgi:hypothetical protein